MEDLLPDLRYELHRHKDLADRALATLEVQDFVRRPAGHVNPLGPGREELVGDMAGYEAAETLHRLQVGGLQQGAVDHHPVGEVEVDTNRLQGVEKGDQAGGEQALLHAGHRQHLGNELDEARDLVGRGLPARLEEVRNERARDGPVQGVPRAGAT